MKSITNASLIRVKMAALVQRLTADSSVAAGLSIEVQHVKKSITVISVLVLMEGHVWEERVQDLCLVFVKEAIAAFIVSSKVDAIPILVEMVVLVQTLKVLLNVSVLKDLLESAAKRLLTLVTRNHV